MSSAYSGRHYPHCGPSPPAMSMSCGTRDAFSRAKQRSTWRKLFDLPFRLCLQSDVHVGKLGLPRRVTRYIRFYRASGIYTRRFNGPRNIDLLPRLNRPWQTRVPRLFASSPPALIKNTDDLKHVFRILRALTPPESP
jgi:hypothetical protein